ncbi:nuclear transport factor 2 family protein [Alteromonas sp. RKMC-009]|uniref:nuclear transport factor 2 family protein n=1 Tax=Alteromonas sp. RKMC-009 TaxID=2267264 RepID=UPI0019310DDA|nr:nuclear transport factor 2 family protein [Alteromonas sp. RKMC-009]
MMQVEKELISRLTLLEEEKAVSECMKRYMKLCDDLNSEKVLNELLSLFADNAVWEGVGSRYSNSFGSINGQDAIRSMFSKYCKAPPHFSMNLHFLGNETIHISDLDARGEWTLLQPCSMSSGESRLSCAQITAEFRKIDHQWKITLFQTRSIFNRLMNSQWDDQTSQPVPQR